jgi:fluoroquinolone resistance protein
MALDALSASQTEALLREPPVRLSDKRLPDGVKWQPRRIESRQFENIDFRTIRIVGSLLGHPRFRDCEFTRCNFEGTYWSDIEFEDCTFDEMRFGAKLLSYVGRTTFKRCTFRDLQMEVTRFERCAFESSSFADLHWRKVRLEGCTLKDVTMTGEMTGGTTFLGCEMQGLDLSKVRVRDFGLLRSKSEAVSLPENVVDMAIFATVLDDARKVLSDGDFEKFKRVANVDASSRMKSSLDPEMFASLTPAGRDVLLDLLRQRARVRASQ